MDSEQNSRKKLFIRGVLGKIVDLSLIADDVSARAGFAIFIGTAVVLKTSAFELIEVILTHSIVCFSGSGILLWIYLCEKMALVIGKSFVMINIIYTPFL